MAGLLQTLTRRVILQTEMIRHAAVAPADLVLPRQVASSVLVSAGITSSRFGNSRVTFLAVECAFARFRSRMSAAGLPRQVLTMVYNC